jgi:hypothetical protein
VIVSWDTIGEFHLLSFKNLLSIFKNIEFVENFFFISLELFDAFDVFGDHIAVSDILAFNLSPFIDLATFEFIFFDCNFELIGLSIKIFHLFVPVITRWLPKDFFWKLWNLSID